MTVKNNTIRVLVTDDIQDNVSNLLGIIKSINSNMIIKTSSSGEEALTLLIDELKNKKKSFDLIFMDFNMGGMNGADTTTAIRQLESDFGCEKKSVIITWSAAKKSPYEGADDWLPKPPSKKEVLDLLTLHGFIEA